MKKQSMTRCLICGALILTATLSFAQQATRKLSKQAFHDQAQSALKTGDREQVKQLVLSYRGYSILLIESLLDSSVIRIFRNESETGHNDLNAAGRLAALYSDIYNDEYYFNRSERTQDLIATRLKEKAEILQLKNQARQLFYKGEFADARKFYEQVHTGAKQIQDRDEEAASLGSIGAVYFYQGYFDTALVFYEKSLGLLKKTGDKRRIGNRLGNIASVYSDLSNYPKAIAYYEKAQTIRKELDDKRGLGADLNNLGLEPIKIPVDKNGFNIVVKVGVPKIYFSAHMDTVRPILKYSCIPGKG